MPGNKDKSTIGACVLLHHPILPTYTSQRPWTLHQIYTNISQQQMCSRRANMTSSVNFTKSSFSYKKTEQAVGDDVPTPMDTITTVFCKVYFSTQGDVSEKFAAPNQWTPNFSKHTYLWKDRQSGQYADVYDRRGIQVITSGTRKVCDHLG